MKQQSQKGLPARAQSETVKRTTKLFVPTARTDAQEAAIDKAFDEADEVAKAYAPGMAKKEALGKVYEVRNRKIDTNKAYQAAEKIWDAAQAANQKMTDIVQRVTAATHEELYDTFYQEVYPGVYEKLFHEEYAKRVAKRRRPRRQV